MSKRVHRTESRPIFLAIAAALAAVTVAGVVLVAQARRDFTVVARKYAFAVTGSNTAEIHVQQNDLVHVTFSTEDIPHSFTINEYRIHRLEESKALRGKPPAHNTMHQEIVTLRQIFKTALRHGWIEHLPEMSAPYRASAKISHRAGGSL